VRFVASERSWEVIVEGARHPGTLRLCALGEVLDRVAERGDVFGAQLSG
jgi:hypothetical protein